MESCNVYRDRETSQGEGIELGLAKETRKHPNEGGGELRMNATPEAKLNVLRRRK